jgi:hypothetical protein
VLAELSRGIDLRIRNDETVLVNLVQWTILSYVSVVYFQEKFDLKCFALSPVLVTRKIIPSLY